MTAPPPHLLFVVLDWGLGHATRTFPLIQAAQKLQEKGQIERVTVASSGDALAWLRTHVVGLECIEKPSVKIRYSRWAGRWAIAAQLPKFVRGIRDERKWCRAHCRAEGVTHIISDNAYGSWSPGVRSVLITHQLSPAVPVWMRSAARWAVHFSLRPFDEIWVPDWPRASSRSGAPPSGLLSGSMAQGLARDTNRIRFLGPISRFSRNITEERPGPVDIALVASVSGPAPHRERMEHAVRALFLRDGRPALILAGQPDAGQLMTHHSNVTTLYNPTDLQIRSAYLEAEVLICRSGYTTLMDLAALNITAHLVPTPGQPEQIQLAQQLSKHFSWSVLEQREIPLCSPMPSKGFQPEEKSPLGSDPIGDALKSHISLTSSLN